jgi:hypothetical protein
MFKDKVEGVPKSSLLKLNFSGIPELTGQMKNKLIEN